MAIKIILFVLLFCVILTIIAIVIHNSHSSKLSQFCNSNSDCPAGDQCIPNPEFNNQKQCFPSNQKFCNVTPNTALLQCKTESDCSVCLNNPQFACITVSTEQPYVWKQGNTSINIPNSPRGFGWCLPNLVNRNITCNQYTSDYVLIQNSDGSYEWGCSCKYPNLFDHGGSAGSDCTHVRACGEDNGNGLLYVPTQIKCSEDSQCADGQICRQEIQNAPCGPQPIPNIDCSGSTGSNCVCHTQWMGDAVTSIDPLSGRCECSPGLEFQCVARDLNYYEFNCTPDSCYPYSSTTQGCKNCADPNNCTCCVCPTGFIGCPDDIPSSNNGLITYCQNQGAVCLPDPCSTPDVPGGYWNGEYCVCGNEVGVGIFNDENSPVGQICRNYCTTALNPCGNRGDCYLPENSQQAACCNCTAAYTNSGDATCSCNAYRGRIVGDACCQDSDCLSGDCGDAPDCAGVWGSFQLGKCHGKDPPNPVSDQCGQPCTVSPPNPPQVCGNNSDTCPAEVSMCCQDYGASTYSCCPLGLNSVCCGDQENHCCPPDNTCDIQAGICIDTKTGVRTPWSYNQ